MTCEQIANKIYKYLKKFESSPIKGMNIYCPNVWGTTKVNIRYVDYHTFDALTKQEALNYLAWLEKGNIGTHRDMEALK
jgi:hypothetical protein